MNSPSLCSLRELELSCQLSQSSDGPLPNIHGAISLQILLKCCLFSYLPGQEGHCWASTPAGTAAASSCMYGGLLCAMRVSLPIVEVLDHT